MGFGITLRDILSFSAETFGIGRLGKPDFQAYKRSFTRHLIHGYPGVNTH